MSATRYGVMMLRFARTVQAARSFNRPLVYPEMGVAQLSIAVIASGNRMMKVNRGGAIRW